MVKNILEKEIKIKMLKRKILHKLRVAEKAGTTGSYVSRLINKIMGL